MTHLDAQRVRLGTAVHNQLRAIFCSDGFRHIDCVVACPMVSRKGPESRFPSSDRSCQSGLGGGVLPTSASIMNAFCWVPAHQDDTTALPLFYMEMLRQSQYPSHPVHRDLLELCAGRRADPIEARIRHASGVQIGYHGFECADRWKVRKELAMLPVGYAR